MIHEGAIYLPYHNTSICLIILIIIHLFGSYDSNAHKEQRGGLDLDTSSREEDIGNKGSPPCSSRTDVDPLSDPSSAEAQQHHTSTTTTPTATPTATYNSPVPTLIVGHSMSGGLAVLAAASGGFKSLQVGHPLDHQGVKGIL